MRPPLGKIPGQRRGDGAEDPRRRGRALEEIRRSGSQEAILDSMQSRAEIYELLSYEGYEARDEAYLGGSSSGDHDAS